MPVPTPLSPVGAVYTVTPPIHAPVQNPALCGAQKTLVNTQFRWADTGAATYELYADDGCTLTGPTINADVSAATHCSGGVCAYTPVTQMAASLTAAWWVREAGGVWSQPTRFSVNYIGVNSFETVPGQWYYSTDAPGCGARIVDFSSVRTGLTGGDLWPMGDWNTVSVLGLVPAGTTALATKVMLIQTIDTGQPTLGFKTRRHTSPPSEDPEPYGGFMYTTASRVFLDTIVLLGPDLSFDFCYSDAFNGNVPSGTVTGRAITMMIVGYCRPLTP